jgi:predicted nucleic acid-binding protein
LTLDDVRGHTSDLQLLPIEAEPVLSPAAAQLILELAIQHNLTVYDAVYLDLALRLNLPLATLDLDLRKAATTAGVLIL